MYRMLRPRGKTNKMDPVNSGSSQTKSWTEVKRLSLDYKWPRGHLFLNRQGEALRLDHKARRQDHHFPNFQSLTQHNLSNINIRARKFSRTNKSLEPKKASSTEKLPIVILKNINPKLSPFPQKLSKRCLKEKYFQNLCLVSNFCSVFRYRPISSDT